MRRTLLALAALVFLAMVVRWLVTRPVVRFTLGPAREVVATLGVESFVVGEAGGVWRLYDTAAREPSDGQLLPVPVLGRPCLQADGSVWVLTDQGLILVHGSRPMVPGGEVVLAVPSDRLPADTRLAGVLGGRDPVLSAPVQGSGERQLLLRVGGPVGSPNLMTVRDTQAEARVPADGTLVFARSVPALAFVGENGWEVWRIETSRPPLRVVATGCTRPGAVFTPDGRALIVPGRTDGIWLLSLADGRLDLMAEGNLGVSSRVASSAGFRIQPELLVAPSWGLEGFLQINQTHLSGGGRTAFGASFVHHYGVALSADGNFMTYAQAGFNEQATEPFVEELYLFDFSNPSDPAVYLDSRDGGLEHQGPQFLGDGGSLVYVAHGDAMRIEVQPPSSPGESP